MANFRSKLEQRFSSAHPRMKYEVDKIPYISSHTYTPDFKVKADVYVETKGRFLGSDRSKHLRIKEQQPHITIIFVFQNPHMTLSKKSKTTYADWCDKNDFLWAAEGDEDRLARLIQSA